MDNASWFERLLAELRLELRIGDAAEIRTKRVRRQKTDRQDAQLLLTLLMEDADLAGVVGAFPRSTAGGSLAELPAGG